MQAITGTKWLPVFTGQQSCICNFSEISKPCRLSNRLPIFSLSYKTFGQTTTATVITVTFQRLTACRWSIGIKCKTDGRGIINWISPFSLLQELGLLFKSLSDTTHKCQKDKNKEVCHRLSILMPFLAHFCRLNCLCWPHLMASVLRVAVCMSF